MGEARSMQPDLVMAAMHNIAVFAEPIANRPNDSPEREESLMLRKPACEWECATCYMGCAIAPARLAWWEGELAKGCGSAKIGRA